MPLRLSHIAAAGALAFLLGACASQKGEAIDQAARDACESQHVQGDLAMQECITQMMESIQQAREYRPASQSARRPPAGGGG